MSSAAPRLYVAADPPLAAGAELDLPPAAARHVQVLRLQPGSAVVVFDGRGGEARATVLHMTRSVVRLHIDSVDRAVERELPFAVTLAVGAPANDRMDALVEKATELGASAIVPLICERSVLRLEGERAARRVAHWQAVAAAACEQCGRNRVPTVAPMVTLPAWLRTLAHSGTGGSQPAATGATAGATGAAGATSGTSAAGAIGAAGMTDAVGAAAVRWLLSPHAAPALPQARQHRKGKAAAPVLLLSGPEGGLAPAEEKLALAAGFEPVALGPRILRADTAPLAALAWLAVQAAGEAVNPRSG